MTQIPSGWYPDPGTSSGLRWWDGEQWTAHTQAPDPQPGPPPYQQVYGQPRTQSGPPPAYGVRAPATTPDGQRLAGWWHRVGAYLLDVVLLVVLSSLVAFPFTRRLLVAYGDFLSETMRAVEAGGDPPSQSALLADVAGPLAGFALVALLVSLVYHVTFLKTLAATPGKLATGLRVRLREQPGPLSWRTVLTRWAGQNVGSLVALVPVLGFLGQLYPLVDGLWPLRDAHKQALHDKLARTNVVRHDRDRVG